MNFTEFLTASFADPATRREPRFGPGADSEENQASEYRARVARGLDYMHARGGPLAGMKLLIHDRRYMLSNGHYRADYVRGGYYWIPAKS